MRDDRSRPPAGQHDSAAQFGVRDYEGMPLAVLRRYVKQTSDAAEQRRVEAWVAQSPSRGRYLDALCRLLERAPAHSLGATQRAWSRLAAQLDERGAHSSPRPAVARLSTKPTVARLFPSRRGSRSVALLAAGTLLAALAGSMLLDRAAARSDAPAVSTAMRVISTAAGQRADIRLSDGTRVSLGVDSRLRVAPDFGERSRDLYLDGTAYFDVVHDSTRPFRVHTATAVAQDVGTRFVVSAYRESGSTEVVVAAGSVTLRAPHDSSTRAVQLGAGNLARIGGRNAPVVVRAVDPSQYLAWMDGRLVFHDTPLSDVVAELHRWYDEDVRIGDSTLAELPLTASFDAASLRETLKVITTVLPLRAVRRDGVVTLYRR
jgi:transmembrane sensor